METPLVSVITITYNHEKFILDTVQNVLVQETKFNFEYIIADDCSTDSTEKLIRSFLKDHARSDIVFYTRHQSNLGMQKNFLWALKRARGKYIAFCEGDDYWTDKYKLQKQVDFMEFHSKSVLTYHSWVEKIGNKTFEPDNLFSSTHTIMFRNHVEKIIKYMDIPILNLDTALKLLLSQHGVESFIAGINPAIKRRDSGGVWNSLDKSNQAHASLNTAKVLFSTLKGTIYEKKARLRVVKTLLKPNIRQALGISHIEILKYVLKHNLKSTYLTLVMGNLKAYLSSKVRMILRLQYILN